MPRPRKFDEERALHGAMHLFWERGYEATSTQDLCTATGLGRSSIYNTFASKHALFLRSLTHYLEKTLTDQRAILDDSALPAAERCRALLAFIIEGEESNRREGRAIGCFAVNTSTELAGHDREVTELLQHDLRRRLAGFHDTLAAGQHAGDITRTRRPGELALFLNATIAGIRIAARNGADRTALEAIAACALDSLTR